MDGSQAGTRLGNRHIQPISTYFAVTALPDWVLALATQGGNAAIRINLSTDALGRRITFLSRGFGPGPIAQLWLIYSDFLIIQNIAETLPIPLFPQESQASILSRIKGVLQVQFANRGTFDAQR